MRLMSGFLTLLTVLGLSMFAWSASADQSYIIRGDVSELAEEGKAVLWRFAEKTGIEEVESVPVISGKFVIQGKVEWIGRVQLAVKANDEHQSKIAGVSDLIMEPGETRITFRAKPHEPEIQSSGKYYQSIFAEWKQNPEYLTAQAKRVEIGERLDNSKSESERNAIIKQIFEPLNKALDIQDSALRSVVENSIDPMEKFFAERELQSLDQRRGRGKNTKEQLSDMYAFLRLLPESREVSRVIGRLEERQKRENNAERFAIGAKIDDFSALDINGQNFQLSSVQKNHKYVLVEFWASWCGPCREEIPSLKKAYKEYHDKGFEIVSFSLDDQEGLWRDASDDEDLPWINTSDLKAMKSPVIEQFGVLAVPANYLIDQNGQIVSKNLRGDALSEKLEELL